MFPLFFHINYFVDFNQYAIILFREIFCFLTNIIIIHLKYNNTHFHLY